MPAFDRQEVTREGELWGNNSPPTMAAIQHVRYLLNEKIMLNKYMYHTILKKYSIYTVNAMGKTYNNTSLYYNGCFFVCMSKGYFFGVKVV